MGSIFRCELLSNWGVYKQKSPLVFQSHLLAAFGEEGCLKWQDIINRWWPSRGTLDSGSGDATGTFWMYIKSSRTTCTGTSYDSFFCLTDVILSQLCILPHQDASLDARCVFDMSLLNPDGKKQQNDTEESCSWIRCFSVSFRLFAVYLHPFLPRDISPISRHPMEKKNPKPWSKNLKLRCRQVHNSGFTG